MVILSGVDRWDELPALQVAERLWDELILEELVLEGHLGARSVHDCLTHHVGAQ